MDDLQDWPLHTTTTSIARTFGVDPADVEAAFVILPLESEIGTEGGIVLTFADARRLSRHFDATSTRTT